MNIFGYDLKSKDSMSTAGERIRGSMIFLGCLLNNQIMNFHKYRQYITRCLLFSSKVFSATGTVQYISSYYTKYWLQPDRVPCVRCFLQRVLVHN
jgi:hypothetical protein